MSGAVRVLGIDPGLSRCGYGVVHQVGRKQQALCAGVIRTDPADATPQRLAELQAEVRTLLVEQKPDVVAIERVLFQVNVRTAMAVGQASGVIMAEAAAAGAAVVEYSPNEVKLAVAGWGGADKQQMVTMVQSLLGLTVDLKPVDAADALALALCHLANHGTTNAIAAAMAGSEPAGPTGWLSRAEHRARAKAVAAVPDAAPCAPSTQKPGKITS